jgi:hypothetical protein
MEPTNQQTYQTYGKRTVWIGLLVALAAVVVAGVVLGLYLLRPVSRARELFFESARLRVGRAGLKDVERIATRFGTPLGRDCTTADCFLAIMVDNGRLPDWWRGPGTTFGASFLIEGGALVREAFLIRTGVGPNAPFVRVTEGKHLRELPEPVSVGRGSTSEDLAWRLIIDLTPEAPLEVKERYLSANFWCLAKFHGCKDAGEMLPTVDWNK